MALIQAKGRLESAFNGWLSSGVATVANGTALHPVALGARRNMVTAFEDRKAAIPVGHLASSAWFLPQEAGGMSMQADAAGDLSGDLVPSRAMSLDLTGAGGLVALAGLAVAMSMSMTGTGVLAATINGRADGAIAMSGSGSLAADLSALGNMIIDMLGAGDLDATIAAYGNMSIDIVVTGAGLSTDSIAAAVWDRLAAQHTGAGTFGATLSNAEKAAKLAAALSA
jgi:hypothetical protein